MKKLTLTLFLFSLVVACTENPSPEGKTNLAEYINPMIGTDSRYLLSNGNTYPAVALPWGMNFWTPQTSKMGDGWTYNYSSDKIRGIKQTHQASPWLNDYGAFSLFAMTGEAIWDEEKRQSWFTHKSEISKAYYYSVYLADYNTTMEVCPTERAAVFRVTFPESDSSWLLIDGYNKGSYISIDPGSNIIKGYVTNNHGGVPDNFKNYFIIHCSHPIERYISVRNDSLFSQIQESKCDHAGLFIGFETAAGEEIEFKVSSSFISWEQATLNLKREIGKNSFKEVKETAVSTWNKKLNRIQLEGGNPDQLSTFYTALYRTMLFPRSFYEYDENNQVIHYSPYNGKIEKGYMFTDNGFWDTFRAVFPLFNLMFRDMNSKFMAGLANTYRESGWLPEWASPGHRNVMIGSNSASLISDAWLKGIDIPDIELLFEAILKNSENEGPIHSVGRYGVDYYNSMGYIPYDVGIRENTARTLEYAYDDYTIKELAESLGKSQELIDRFARRSMNYKHVFDSSTNFMRGKNLDGSFQSPFLPDKWGDAFTEGCSWHWTWCVFHDIQGLINMMGGDENLSAKLDAVFTTPPTADHSYYGFQIHEITEMKIINMGQYAHGNQPIQHMPYLYNYCSEPWKSQYHVRNIMKRLYLNSADGLCGDEDNGQTSAWYVFSALGMYPVTPGSGQYVLGSPLFRKASLELENGKHFVIEAHDNSDENIYIREARLNGKSYSKNYLEHEDVMEGGRLIFKMGNLPEKSRGIEIKDKPFSVSKR